MSEVKKIPTSRIEAFSDGVIAIIVTVMVFDLKLHEIPAENGISKELIELGPKLISYAVSFLTISIMWVNHHQLFHQIKNTDSGLLWYNIHLLFWMTLIPFGTNFIGANFQRWEAAFFYAIIFSMSAVSFTLLRNYVIKKGLLHEAISKPAHLKILKKNKMALFFYLLAAFLSPVSVYISFIFFLIVPAMYFIPEKILQDKNKAPDR